MRGNLYKYDVEIVHSDAKKQSGLGGGDGHAGKCENMVIMESLLNAEVGMSVETRDENENSL